MAQRLREAAQRPGSPVAQHGCERWSHICAAAGLAAVLAAFGCAAAPSGARPPDGGSTPPTCSTLLVCGNDGAVHTCDGQVVGALRDDCAARGQDCSLGRCTTSACSVAESSARSLSGCLFYTVQPDNVAADEAATTSYVISNAGPDPANVRLEHATSGSSEGTDWELVKSVQILAGSAGRLQADSLQVTNPGTTPFSAVRISSDRPITVSEIESDDARQPATSTSGTVILPLQSLGANYRAVTYAQEPTEDVQQWVGGRGGAGRVIIVGTQPGTKVSFRPVTALSGDVGQFIGPLAAGDVLPIALNDGDVFQIYTNAPDEDLTGGLITVTAGAPVAVFSGNISTSYGSNQTGINSADMAHEQMLPLSSWSTDYLAAPVPPQGSIGCTSFFGDSQGVGAGSIWRVVANQDSTEVDLGLPTPETVWLDAGQAVTRVSATPFTVHATAPVMLTQGMDCEPSLSLGISVSSRALLTDYAFAAVPVFDQMIAVVRPAGVEIDLDGVPIPDAKFRPVGDDFDWIQIPLPACNAATGACLHRLTAPSPGFGVTIRGMDVSASFALTAPGLMRCDFNSNLCLN